MKAMNECLENFDGILRITGTYSLLEKQVIVISNILKNEEKSFFVLFSKNEKNEFYRQYIKLFIQVFLCPPVMISNLANYFNYISSGKFYLENFCFMNLYENINGYFVTKITVPDQYSENIIENFFMIIIIFIDDFKGKFYF